MSRKQLIPILSGNPLTLRQLAQRLGLKPTEAEDDLRHLVKSLVHGEWRLVVTPARCRKCGFEFGPDKLHKPSKCPECQATWLTEPEMEIVGRDA
jgi:predicted Zn-ribbon and HTH transcriptional regulator